MIKVYKGQFGWKTADEVMAEYRAWDKDLADEIAERQASGGDPNEHQHKIPIDATPKI